MGHRVGARRATKKYAPSRSRRRHSAFADSGWIERPAARLVPSSKPSKYRRQAPGARQSNKCYLLWQHHGFVGKHRRGGYVFITWKGDHPPRHVHVYRDGKFVVKWDLDNKIPMKGFAQRRVLGLIAELEAEGVL